MSEGMRVELGELKGVAEEKALPGARLELATFRL